MLTRIPKYLPSVALSDVEYLALKIAFNPGCSAKWYIDHLRRYAGVNIEWDDKVPYGYDFTCGQIVKFTWRGLEAGLWLAREVPTSALKREHLLKGVPSSDNIRGYVLTNAGLEIARNAAVKIGIDPDTIPL